MRVDTSAALNIFQILLRMTNILDFRYIIFRRASQDMGVLASLLNWIPGSLETGLLPMFFLLCKLRYRFYDPADIGDYQYRRAVELARYAAKKSTYFNRLYEGKQIEDFYSLPFVNKKKMMDNLTDYNTVNLTKEEIIAFCLEVERSRVFTQRLHGINVGLSSGTSGNKGVEIATRSEEMYMKAALFARFAFPKGEKLNLAFILRVSSPAFNLNILGHRMIYISQLDTIANINSKLEIIQPNVISAPPSMLKIIAREVEKERLHISPKRLVSYAEILYPDVKDYLTRVFGCPVHEIYKCTEGPIAISCRCGNLHINEDLVLVEVLNNDGTYTEPGKPCQRLVVTDLHKKSQPIIRYELNDIITISSVKCPCGSSFRVIQSIQGRADDVFWAKGKDTGKWQYISPDYISRAVITASDEVYEYQVVQASPEEVLVRIQLIEGASQKLFDESRIVGNITGVFRSYGCNDPKIEVVFGRPEPNPNSDKLIRIHRAFEVSDDGR